MGAAHTTPVASARQPRSENFGRAAPASGSRRRRAKKPRARRRRLYASRAYVGDMSDDCWLGPRRDVAAHRVCAGSGIAAAVGVPVVRMLADPASKITVTGPSAPIDLGPLDRLKIGADPVSVPVVAKEIRDGWNAVQQVVLGSAYLTRTHAGDCTALSSVCPHLACTMAGTRASGTTCARATRASSIRRASGSPAPLSVG